VDLWGSMNQVLARGPDPPMGRGISWGHTWAYQVLLVVDKLNVIRKRAAA